MGRNATLKDVAEKVGLSVASVSLVLNQKPNRISLESQERIFAAAEQLGYKPKFRQPRRPLQKPITLGLILPEISNSFLPTLCRASMTASATTALSSCWPPTANPLNGMQNRSGSSSPPESPHC